MKYIKLLLKTLCYPLFFLNDKVKQTNWYANQFLDSLNYPTNEWYRNHLERNYDIVNIGSSNALYAFDYSESAIKGFNWALQPQSMEYGFKVIQNFFSILKRQGVVLIPLGPFSGLSVLGKWANTSNDRYYGILSPELIDDYESVSKRCSRPLFVHPKGALKHLVKDDQRKHQIYLEKQIDFNFEEDAKIWVANWKKEFNIIDLDAPLSDENKKRAGERAQVLSQLVEFCLKRDLQPIFVIPPMHASLSSYFSDTFRKNYIYSFIESINKWKIPFLNYMDYPDFMNDDYFANAFFMTRAGARTFTQQVLKDCKLIRE